MDVHEQLQAERERSHYYKCMWQEAKDAIMAERERCAKIADQIAGANFWYNGEVGCQIHKHTALIVSSSIRTDTAQQQPNAVAPEVNKSGA